MPKTYVLVGSDFVSPTQLRALYGLPRQARCLYAQYGEPLEQVTRGYNDEDLVMLEVLYGREDYATAASKLRVEMEAKHA